MGGLFGGLASGPIERSLGVGKAMIVSMVSAAICVIVLGLSSVLFISMIAEFFLVLSFVVNGVMFNAVLSVTIDAEVRGRVMALGGIITMISIPIMNIIAGIVGDIVGVSIIFIAAGTWVLIIIPFMIVNKKIRTAKL